MAYLGTPPRSRVLSSADIATGAVTLDDISFTDQPTSVNVSGAINKHTMRLSDQVVIDGDLNITDNLILSKISDDGNAITLTNDSSTRTITGTGSLEAGTLTQTPNASLTGMTGEIGSAVTGTLGSGFTIGTAVKFSDFPTPNLNLADGDGNTRSPVARDNKTWWYGDFGDAAGTGTWANSGTVLTNVATGTNRSNETLPISTVQRKTTDNLGASYAEPSGDTEAVRRDPASGDPFLLGSAGMTMGCLFKNMHSGAGAKGVIYYGQNTQGMHFYTRTNYNAHGQILVGGDTDTSDNWITCTKINTQANGWAFFVVAEGVTGSLHCSYNGSAYDLVRARGTLTNPNACAFGLFGDLYDDNESAHKFATCFWYEGIMSEELIRAEYRFIKNKWSNITDLP